MQGDGREQLGRDAVPWLAGRQLVWLRAASAYSCKDLVSSGRQRGWDDSGSVTDPRQKAPILRLAAARALREDEGEPLDAAGKERKLAGAYRPARGAEEPVGGVLRRDGDGEHRWLEPVCTVIPVSRDRLPLAELGRRHRGQQGAGVPGTADGPGPAAPAVPLARGESGFLPRRADRTAAAAAAVPGAAVRGAAARAAAADPVPRGQRGAADAQRTAAAAAVPQEQPVVGLAAARGEPEGAGLGLGRRGRSRAGPSGRGPPRSPRGARCARSRGRSGRDAGAGRRRAPAGVPRSLGDGLRGPRGLSAQAIRPRNPHLGKLSGNPVLKVPGRLGIL